VYHCSLLRPRLCSLILLLFIPLEFRAQTYTYKASYDSLDTRHDLSRPLIERWYIHANHGAACFNLGLKDEIRVNAKEGLALAEQLGVDSFLAVASHHVGDAFYGSADAELQLKYYYQGLHYAQRTGALWIC
jgi:hypothetical protein